MLRMARHLGEKLLPALAIVCLLAAAVAAQQLSPAERTRLETQKAELFQRMLRNPADLDVTFAYADISAKLGDNEGAVSALERMLLFNPNLPRVQLELGTLYFRMGSYEIARDYFGKALAANPPPEVRQRVETYLAEIGRMSAPERFSGFVLFGVQYQSNANQAGASQFPSVIFGVPVTVTLTPPFVKQRDANIFGTTSVLYSYDLGTQSRDTLEVSGTGFANHYFSVDRFDLGLAEVAAGPRFNFTDPLPDVSSASLKPYALTNDVSLGGNQYFYTVGLGGEATALAWDDVRLRSVFEFRNKNYNNAPDRPLSRGQTGSDKLVQLFASKPTPWVLPDSELSLEFDFLDQDARLGFFSNRTYAGSIAYRVRYDDPTGYLRLPLETTVFVSRGSANYAGPDPCCAPPTVRSDRRWRFGITHLLPITKDVSLVLQAQRDVVSSSLPVYAYVNNSFVVGPQIRF